MTRKAIPIESKRIARCVVCSPATWQTLDRVASLSGVPVGRVVDQIAKRMSKGTQ